MLRAESDSPDRSSESATPEAYERRKDPDIEDVVMHDAEDRDLQHSREERDSSDAAESSGMDAPDGGEDKGPYVSRLGAPPIDRNRKVVPRPRTKALLAEQGLRSRMLDEGDGPKLRLSKEKVYTYNFGSELDDLYPILRSRDVWHLETRDVVLPSRASMKEALRLELAGKYLGQQQINEGGDQDDAVAADQENLPGRNSPNRQQIKKLDDEEAARQLFWDKTVANEVVIGPTYEARKHKLELLHPLKIAEAGQPRKGAPSSYHNDVLSVLSPPRKTPPQPELQPVSQEAAQDQPENRHDSQALPSNARHPGWLINLGARPQYLAWAPVISDSQYLAVAFKCSKAQRDAALPKPTKLAPAFSPSPDYPSHIQIWRIMAQPGESSVPARLSHDLSCAPHLLQRLCMKTGNILRFEWLPLSPSDTSASVAHRSMVVLSSDGDIRIITIDLTAKGTFEIAQPQLIVHSPSHTIFSCFTLPSHEDLVVGGADGAVRLYNLHPDSDAGELEPYTTIQIHNTYIMNIAVAFDLPYYLASSSANGEMILTDLRSPQQDRVRLHKSRLPTRNLTYLPHTRIFLSTSDASGNSEAHGTSLTTVIGQNLRHFYHSNTLMRLPEASGIATILATSPFHPIVLVANAAGSVFASNLLRRLLPTPSKDESGGGFMMKLFETDWIPLKQDELAEEQNGVTGNDLDQNVHGGGHSAVRTKPTHRFIPHPTEAPRKPNADTDVFHGANTRPGITRIYEHFRPERIELNTYGQNHTGSKGRSKNKGQRIADNTPNAASYQIICHEEQAVTAMAWNGVGRFAGWAAVAWGSGILRIQDMAHGG